MEEIDFLVSIGKIVTYRGLACSLDVSYEVAISILTEYHNQHQSTRTTYFVSGITHDSQHIICIVKDNELESATKLFTTLNSKHIYSVHKDSPLNIFTQLSEANNEQKPNNDKFFLNSQSNIKNGFLTLRPVGVRALPSTPSLLPLANIAGATAATVKKVVSSSAKEFFKPSTSSSAAKISPNITGSGNTTVATVSNGNKVSAKAQPTSSVADEDNSRGDDISADTKKKDTVKNSKASVSESDSGTMLPKEKEPSTSAKKVEEDEDEEWDDGGGYQTKPKEVNKKKTFRPAKKKGEAFENDATSEKENVRLASEVVGVEDSEEQDREECHAKKQKVAVVGAMDGFVKSNEDKIESRVVELNLGSGGGKKVMKRLVEKMYMDERGFLVTNMEWEEVEVDESEGGNETAVEEEKLKPAATTVKRDTAPPQNKKGKGKVTASDAAPQRSISSFFSKK